jgi:hypothetical protein
VVEGMTAEAEKLRVKLSVADARIDEYSDIVDSICTGFWK